MKYINIKIYILLACICCLSLSSCYDDMESYETANENTQATSQYTDSVDSPEIGVMFLREAQCRVIDTREHKYQYQFNLHIDDYAGYMSVPHNFESRIASSFAFSDEFASGPKTSFTWVAQQTVPVMNSAKKMNIEPIGAISSIIFSYAAHQFSNVHGPFPYKDFRALKERHPLNYDKLSDIYTWTFEVLDSAILVLQKYQQYPDAEMDLLIEQTDMVSGVTGASSIVTQWLKLANSLRLRMAMNIVKVENYTYNGMTAQQIAEDAVSKGVLQKGDPTFGIRPATVTEAINHPLFKISKSWLDTRLNASMENILRRTQNPMLERWFNKNLGNLRNVNKKTALAKGEKHIGIRSGIYLRDRSYDQDYKLFSDLSDYLMKEVIAWFKVEEVLFLQAEGALRGWNMGGSAENFYDEAIRESFDKNGQSPDDYEQYMAFRGMGDITVSDEDKANAIYKDYYDPDNDIPRWDGYYMLNNRYGGLDTNPYVSASTEAGNKELQLEKIITQKWIALFPMSLVAWTDYRRTGYPKLLPACDFAYVDADGTIYGDEINWSTGETVRKGLYIRRMPYNTGGDSNIKSEIAATALDALGEGAKQLPDKQGTRLWWDIDKSNF